MSIVPHFRRSAATLSVVLPPKRPVKFFLTPDQLRDIEELFDIDTEPDRVYGL
jgi:hypothetical protein